MMEAREPAVAAMAIPNLGSIMVLAQSEGRKVLLTGDGRGDHLLEGLGRVGVLDASGYTRVKRWRVYAEEGLASCEVADWLGDGEMALKCGGRTLSSYEFRELLWLAGSARRSRASRTSWSRSSLVERLR